MFLPGFIFGRIIFSTTKLEGDPMARKQYNGATQNKASKAAQRAERRAVNSFLAKSVGGAVLTLSLDRDSTVINPTVVTRTSERHMVTSNGEELIVLVQQEGPSPKDLEPWRITFFTPAAGPCTDSFAMNGREGVRTTLEIDRAHGPTGRLITPDKAGDARPTRVEISDTQRLAFVGLARAVLNVGTQTAEAEVAVAS